MQSKNEELPFDVVAAVPVTMLSLATIVQDSCLFPMAPAGMHTMLLCALSYGLCFALYGQLARIRKIPRLRAMCVIAVVCLIGAWVASNVLPIATSAVCFLAVSALSSLGRAWVLCVVGLSMIDRSPEDVLKIVAIGIATSHFLAAMTPAWMAIDPWFLFVLVVLLGMIASLRMAEKSYPEGEDTVPPRELEVTNPTSFMPLTGFVYVAIALFETSFGLFAAFSMGDTEAVSAACALLMVAIATGIYRMTRRSVVDIAYDVAALLLMATALLSFAGGAGLGGLTMLVSLLASQLFRALTWVILTSVAHRNKSGALVAICTGLAVSAIATAAGGLASSATERLSDGVSAEVFVAVALGLFCFFYFGATRNRMSREIEQVVEAVPVLEVSDVRSDIGSAVESLAESRHLTARESEVLVFLARGRTSTVIQEELGISRNTVKTHVKHVYQKLGVHTQQELIDLVEDEA